MRLKLATWLRSLRDPSLLELGGLASIVAGVELKVGWWAALIVAGVFAVTAAVALERMSAGR